MGAELGILGVVLFALFVAGVANAGRRALRQGAPLAPGACAVCVAWLLHATIDWDWQLPAVTLPAVALAGAPVALGEAPVLSGGRSRDPDGRAPRALAPPRPGPDRV